MHQAALLPAEEALSLHLSEATESTAAGIVSRTLLNTPDTRVILFSFAPGQELTPHASPRRAIVQVIEGSCEFFFNERWQTLPTGTLLHMPPGHSHAVRAASGPFVMLLTLSKAEKISTQ